MAEKEATGRHPRKKAEEAWPHAKEQGKQQAGKVEAQPSAGAGAARAREPIKAETRAAKQDLKEREYRDEHGNIHHHTRTFMQQHKGEEK